MSNNANFDDVKSLYLQLLGRQASDEEAAAWVGNSWNKVFYGIKESPEGQAWNKQCRNMVLQEPLNPDDVKSLYLQLLGRQASDEEAAAWVGNSWNKVFYGIKESPEGQAWNKQCRNAIEQKIHLSYRISTLNYQLKQLHSQLQDLPLSDTASRSEMPSSYRNESEFTSNGSRIPSDLLIPGADGLFDNTRAAILAAEDRKADKECRGRRFSEGSRPVIRWIKGDGLDDFVTRAAIGQATRLFGSEVDYCLCTNGIDADRARMILGWADQPVEWWPLSEEDNPQLAEILRCAGCRPEKFGYWWKWFPERVRPDAPEWILDGDMVITGKPPWLAAWLKGEDRLRVAQDNRADLERSNGNYYSFIDLSLKLYSGFISLPPGMRFMNRLSEVLAKQPLKSGHDGTADMCEQGVMVAAFQKLHALPIPLSEFPFARPHEDDIDYGFSGDLGRAWGFHFGRAFIQRNSHFEHLTEEGIIYSEVESDSQQDHFQWLCNTGQWGIPGSTMPDGCARIIVAHAAAFAGKQVLELGTSRGRTAAMLAALGCRVTTIDHIDRGAASNLAGMDVEVIVDDAVHYLSTTPRLFDLVVCDLHGNSPEDWRLYAEILLKRLNPRARLILNNAALDSLPEWREETGVRWFLDNLPPDWKVELFTETPPGVAIASSP